ncbi:hypothetical protein ACXX9E_29560 [Pseudomonas sp. GNP014]
MPFGTPVCEQAFETLLNPGFIEGLAFGLVEKPRSRRSTWATPRWFAAGQGAHAAFVLVRTFQCFTDGAGVVLLKPRDAGRRWRMAMNGGPSLADRDGTPMLWRVNRWCRRYRPLPLARPDAASAEQGLDTANSAPSASRASALQPAWN